MATQMVSQPSGSNLFCNSGNFGIGDMYGLHDLSKAEMAAPRLIMLANVALTGEANNGCCDYSMDEDRQMAELTTVYDNSYSDSDGERMEIEESNIAGESDMLETMNEEPSGVQEEKPCDQQPTSSETRLEVEPEKKNETSPSRTEDKTKCVKSKPFRCRPCQYQAESEEEFVHHIKDHSAKRFIDHDSNKNVQDSGSCSPEEVDFSIGPIRCDRCGYNTNRLDHYLAHLKHHDKASDNERVYKCTICTYTTVSEYHWKKHLRNHFPRIVYTCSQCSYFSDRKNNYIQHIRTHTGERPYQCFMCPYSSSQKTHLTRHMRTHSGEKPFKCEHCSYVASNQHEVTRHARQVHNGPKPLTCPHCNYKTADRSNFKKHVELHVNPRQFMCPVCDYAASKKCNLQYHIKSRHSGCTDIAMDVSKVKLRTRKGDATGSDVDSSKQEEKENSDVKSEPQEKKSDVKSKVDKEKSVKMKRAASPLVEQITTRSHKSTSKTEENKIPDRGKGAKRKSSVVSEKPLKMNETQNSKVKKRRLMQKNKHTHNVSKKTNQAGKSEKQKVPLKKTSNKKPLKNKHKKMTISNKTANSKSKSGKSTTQKDSETVEMRNTIDETNSVPLAEHGLKSATKPTEVEVQAITKTESAVLGTQSKAEISAVSEGSVSDPNMESTSSALESTPESNKFLLKNVNELDPNSIISPVAENELDPNSIISPVAENELEPNSAISPVAENELEPNSVLSPVTDHELEPNSVISPVADHELEPNSAISPVTDHELEPNSAISPVTDHVLEPNSVINPVADHELEPNSAISPVTDHELEPNSAISPVADHELEPNSAISPVADHEPEPNSVISPVADHELDPNSVISPAADHELEPNSAISPVADHELEPNSAIRPVADHEFEPNSAISPVADHEPEPNYVISPVADHELDPNSVISPAADHELEPNSAISPVADHEPEPNSVISPAADHELEPNSAMSPVADHELKPNSEISPVADNELELDSIRPVANKGNELEPSSIISPVADQETEPEPNSVISPVTDISVVETHSAPDLLPSTSASAENAESIPEEKDCNHEMGALHCSGTISEDSQNVNESESNSSLEKHKESGQTTPRDTEQVLSPKIAQDINNCDPKQTVHTQCEATSHEPLDIDEDEGIHSHEGSEISDNISERSDDSGLNSLQSPQETLESQPLLEVPSVSTSVSNESFVCIFCDRVFKKAEEYTKHLKRHLVNVYYLEKAAQNRL
ncbi:RE1-silencing transcription factor [Ranitomeya imitator]|uniref:RE1-silencing transcription factor n=1 Tax=Ranitomeya imitator TaxID=111125 RepID=UPI0037E8D75D